MSSKDASTQTDSEKEIEGNNYDLVMHIEETITKLENKRETHPNFVNVWTLYLREKLKNLKEMAYQCENIANLDFSDTPDLDPFLLASVISIF